MYPVDVTQDAQYYFMLDAGRYRLIAVNRATHNIDFQFGGLQSNGKSPGFGDARALDYDAAHNLLFAADTPNNRVEVFSFSSSTGFTYLTQFGTRGAGNGQFSQTYGVAVDAANNWVYVVDGAGRVEKFSLNPSPNPPVVTYLSQFGKGDLVQPRQVTVGPNGDVFVTNRESALKKSPHNMCYVYSSSGALLFSFGAGGKGSGQFSTDPRGISLSDDGTLAFATDTGGDRIEAFTLAQSGGHYSSATWSYTIPSGTGNAAFVGPRGLTTTADNHLLLTDEWGYNYHEFSFTPGTTTYAATYNSTPTTPPVPGVNAPRGVSVAANGQVYVVDYWNQRIEYMNANGTGAQAFGARGDPSQPGAINFAWSAAIQPGTGNIFLANRESDQVQVFSPTGTSISIFGKVGTADGQFKFPQGIAFAPDGTLLVVDSANDRIQRFTMSPDDTVATWDASYGQKGTGVELACRRSQHADRHLGRARRHHLDCRHAEQPNPEQVDDGNVEGHQQARRQREADGVQRPVGRDRRTGREHLGVGHRPQPARVDRHLGQSQLQRDRVRAWESRPVSLGPSASTRSPSPSAVTPSSSATSGTTGSWC